jgi:hypothetical protein
MNETDLGEGFSCSVACSRNLWGVKEAQPAAQARIINEQLSGFFFQLPSLTARGTFLIFFLLSGIWICSL